MSIQNVLIIGANSAIAEAVGRRFAEGGANIGLIGRDRERLENLAGDLLIRGASQTFWRIHDVSQSPQRPLAIEWAFDSLGTIDAALIAHGVLPDEELCRESYENFRSQLEVNFLSTTHYMELLARRMTEADSKGVIAVISSVAGDRGRASNVAYGSAKAGLNAYASGLRNRLFPTGIHVLTIKPGFVDTPMTSHIKKGPLFASPDKVARDIISAMHRRKNVLYTPWFWRFIMLMISHLPESLFKRLKL